LGADAALAAAALVALSPSLLFYSRYLRNDIYIALFCLFWVLGSWRYLEERSPRGIALVAAALGLSLVTKEVAFLFGLTAGLFFAGLAFWRRWRAGENLRESAPADLALLLATLVLPFLAALLYPPLGWDPVAYDAPEAPRRALLVAGGLALAAAGVAGVWLRGRRPESGLTFGRWGVAAAGVWGGASLLFTTFGTNAPRGLVSGFVGSLGYWLAQHPVERGGQPWFYYLLLGGLYELVPLLLAAGATVAVLRRRRAARDGGAAADPAERLVDFLVWWLLASAVLYTVAGEKMPWLLVHIALPACLLGGWALARGADALSRRPPWRRALGAAVLSLALLATAGQAGRLAYVDQELATELLVYAHGTPELRAVERELAARASRLPPGERLLVAHDGPASWPLIWYLRAHEPWFLRDGLTPELAERADAVVLAPEGSAEAWPLLARDFAALPFRSVWWPLEGYRTAGWEEAKDLFVDPVARRAALSYLLRRRVPGVDLAGWPLRQELRLHLRRPGPARGAVPLLAAGPVEELWPLFAGDLGSAAELVASGPDGRLAAGEPLPGHAGWAWLPAPPAAWAPLPGVEAAPEAIAYGPGGTLAVAAGGELLLFASDGAPVGRGEVGGIAALAPAAEGGWWGADPLSWRLCRFDAAGRGEGCRPLPFAPAALAVGGDGSLWLADPAGRRLARIDPGSSGLRTVAIAAWEGWPAAGRPGLASASGHLLASDPAGRRVLVLSQEGELLAALAPVDADGEPLLRRPASLAADPARDRLWVADPGGRRIYGFALAELLSAASGPSRTGSER
ncbi:MAG TPA: flippase activity-associated protein Agl23, partial [Thermoanaerobaculia bacterium]|nr:flippase activity-associated protein Agl23 [Thermoanaerobaculia bacterium]